MSLLVQCEIYDDFGHDDVVEPGVFLSVEAYLSEEQDVDGVGLEDQVLIMDISMERFVHFPVEQTML